MIFLFLISVKEDTIIKMHEKNEESRGYPARRNTIFRLYLTEKCNINI